MINQGNNFSKDFGDISIKATQSEALQYFSLIKKACVCSCVCVHTYVCVYVRVPCSSGKGMLGVESGERNKLSFTKYDVSITNKSKDSCLDIVYQ